METCLAVVLLASSAGFARAEAPAPPAVDGEQPGAGRLPQPRPPAPPPPSGGPWRVALSGAITRGTELYDDGFYEDAPGFDAGLEAEYVPVRAGRLRFGLGARYSYGTGRVRFSDHNDDEHIAFVPALLGAAFRDPRNDNEMEVLFGLGVAAAQLSNGAGLAGSRRATGPGAELELNLIHPFGSGHRWGLMVGLSVRYLLLHVNGGPDGAHLEAPVHVGLRF